MLKKKKGEKKKQRRIRGKREKPGDLEKGTVWTQCRQSAIGARIPGREKISRQSTTEEGKSCRGGEGDDIEAGKGGEKPFEKPNRGIGHPSRGL